ncbi:type IV pilin protein [Granulosicoccaceae sp. 1_MG-2023]|nr:type IV pilin protein [Granulosicoccaceae sp. 1_MG-2023]
MRQQTGFTLVELLISVVIIGVLSAVAYPSYVKHVYKARRADGLSAIMDMAQRLERCKTTTFSYAGCIDDGEYSTEGYYYLTLPADELSATAYQIQAEPQGAQAEDDCGTLKMSESGKKYALGSADVDDCW